MTWPHIMSVIHIFTIIPIVCMLLESWHVQIDFVQEIGGCMCVFAWL